MWYVIPTPPFVLDGRERGSPQNREYALRDAPGSLEGFQAASAYIRFPEEDGISLRRNLVEILDAVAAQLERGVSAMQLMGPLDEPKLRSAARLFECVSRADSGGLAPDAEVNAVCRRVLSAMDEPLQSKMTSRQSSCNIT
jgi:hypothetical protein